MHADRSGWKIDVNGEPFASGRDQRAEGWAHAMDRRRATALAIAGFEATGSWIEISSEGRLRFGRNQPGGGVTSLTFWLHFVPMPVQVGAATSPQSMMRPPDVRVE
jgi:hypothetical protein